MAMKVLKSSEWRLEELIEALEDKLTNGKDIPPMFTISAFETMDKKLQNATATLRQLRNSARPINKLPLEVLSIIFRRAHAHPHSFMPPFTTVHTSYSDDGWGNPRPLDDIVSRHHSHWMKLSGVCRRWRDVFDVSPALWSTIDGAFQLQKSLEHSGTTPLTVYFGMRVPTPYVTRGELEQIAPHSSRLVQLHMDITNWEDPISYDRVLSESAHCLSSLTLIYSEDRRMVPGLVGAPADGVLPPLFNNEMPSLKQLSLSWYTSWPQEYFKNLTHLLLFDQSKVTRPTTSAFLDFLDASPLLEELALINAGPTLHDADDLTPISPDRYVWLSHLRALNIGDWPVASTISRLLSHLHLPSKASMHLWGHTIYDDLTSFIPVNPVGLENLATITEWQVVRTRPAHFAYTEPRGIRFCISVINSILYMYGPFQERHISNIPSRYPLGAVGTLTIVDFVPNDFPHISSQAWADLFQHLPSLTSLRISGAGLQVSNGMTRDVISALYSSNPLIGLCPRLKSLVIEEEASIPTLHIVALAEERAKTEHPILKLEVCFTVVTPEPPPEQNSASDPFQRILTETDVAFLRRDIDEVIVNRRQSHHHQHLALYQPSKWSNRTMPWTRAAHR